MRALLGVRKGGVQSQKHFVRKVKSQIPENVSFRISQNSGMETHLESQKSQNLTHGTQESQTFPRNICQRGQKLFTEKSKSQYCKWQKS